MCCLHVCVCVSLACGTECSVVMLYSISLHRYQEYQGADGTPLDDKDDDAAGRNDEQRLPSQLEVGQQCRITTAKLYKGATSIPG